jgi:hypothetical protein
MYDIACLLFESPKLMAYRTTQCIPSSRRLAEKTSGGANTLYYWYGEKNIARQSRIQPAFKLDELLSLYPPKQSCQEFPLAYIEFIAVRDSRVCRREE